MALATPGVEETTEEIAKDATFLFRLRTSRTEIQDKMSSGTKQFCSITSVLPFTVFFL